MKRKLVAIVVAVAFLTSTFGTSVVSEPYVEIAGAYVIASEVNATLQDAALGPIISTDPEDGFAIQGAVGYRWDSFRLEAEASYGRHDIKNLDEFDRPNQRAVGNADILRAFVNAYYDVRNETPLTPFIGAGAGIAYVSANDIGLADSTGRINDSDIAPALQGIAGLEYKVSEAFSVVLKYQFLYIGDVSGTISGGAGDGITESIEEITLHQFGLGLRYRF